MLLIFPPGLTSFIDAKVQIHKPDANGQVEVAPADLLPFLAAGFMFDEVQTDAEAAILAARVDGHDTAISTLEGRVDGHDTAIGTLEGRADGHDDSLALLGKALSGDMVFTISPAAVNTPATAAAWQRQVIVALKTAAGEVHAWFNAALAAGVSIADTSLAAPPAWGALT